MSDKFSLQWKFLPRNIEGMLFSEDFLKEKATKYTLHSFENEFYVNGLIEWIHKPSELFCGAEAMWHMLAIRKQIVIKVSCMVYWMLISQQMTTLMKRGVKRYIFTPVLLLQLPFSAINIDTESKNLLIDEVVTLTRRPVSN